MHLCTCVFFIFCVEQEAHVCVCVCWRDRETSYFHNVFTYSTGVHAQTRAHTHGHIHSRWHTNFQQTNISLRSPTKWGNRSKLFAYKLMKYYWVKLSWMLITKVMHYLLINESSPFWAGDGTSGVDDRCGDKKMANQANGGSSQVLGKRGEERRGEERGGRERRGDGWRKGKSVVVRQTPLLSFSGHGHTPQTPVPL